VLSVILLVYLLSRQNWGQVNQALFQITFWRFAMAFLLVTVSRIAVAGRWHVLLKATVVQISWVQSLRLTFAGLFSANFLPTTIGGDIVRLAGAVQMGMDGAVVTASLVADRLLGMFGMLLAFPFGLQPLGEWLWSQRGSEKWISTSVTFMAAAPRLQKIWQKIVGFVGNSLGSIKFWWRKPTSLLGSLLLTVIHMNCFFGILWILFAGLNDPIPYALVAGLYSVVYLVTLLPISINGYGLQELSISVIFSEIGGVSLQSSLTVALLFRTMTMLASLPGAFFVPGIIAGKERE
jgi:uncharacterized membrane protein YbhN (UPF0104 family)